MGKEDLVQRLQPYFPRHSVEDLLDKYSLITKSNAIAPMLFQQGLIKVYERFPSSEALILELAITEHGGKVILAILTAHLHDEVSNN
ncbi:hypothetical protein [Spirosoma daeguense]